jgi:hypothetical protein
MDSKYTYFYIYLKILFNTAKITHMLFSKDPSVEDRVIELVADTRVTIKSLHEVLANEHSLTLRAVYKAVNKLIGEGVLLKVGKQVMVDQEWAKRTVDTLTSLSGPILSAGERAAYTFNSVEHLDAFWKSVVLPLERSADAHESFFYNPHNFWAYLPSRKQSEDAYYQHFKGHEYGFFTVGGESDADKEFKRSYQSTNFQIDLRDIRMFRRTDHVTILDSFIITVRLGKKMAERIDALYASGVLMKDILPAIVALCQKPGKIRFLLENNPSKALKLRKVLARNFYIQQATHIPSS